MALDHGFASKLPSILDLVSKVILVRTALPTPRLTAWPIIMWRSRAGPRSDVRAFTYCELLLNSCCGCLAIRQGGRERGGTYLSGSGQHKLPAWSTVRAHRC